MKKIDVRKIYVCEILRQTEVTERPSADPTRYIRYHYWEYEKASKLGLFVKTLGGYKHVLTGKVYPKPSKRTGKMLVVNPENIEKLENVKKEQCAKLTKKYESFYIDLKDVQKLEDEINTDAIQAKKKIEI